MAPETFVLQADGILVLLHRAFARLTQYFDDQLTLMQQEADQIRKAYNQDTEAFRQEQQLKHTRREWDINRPDAKQLDMPARVGDGDPRLGPSSLQRFDGEDLTVRPSQFTVSHEPLVQIQTPAQTCGSPHRPPSAAVLPPAYPPPHAQHAELSTHTDSPELAQPYHCTTRPCCRPSSPTGGRPQEGAD